MARRLLDAAKAATQLAAWSDLEDNILNHGSSVESEDSEDDLLSVGDNDDETNDNTGCPKKNVSLLFWSVLFILYSNTFIFSGVTS